MRRRLGALCVALALSCATSVASAHVGYPASELVRPDPTNPDRLVVVTSYGFLTTSDPAGDWQRICVGGIGYDAFDDPPVMITDAGTIVVGALSGVFASRDDGCDFVPVEAAGDGPVVDLDADPSDVADAVAILARSVDGGFRDRVWQAKDDVRTWEPLSEELDPNVFTQSIGISPADPNRIYLTAVLLDSGEAVVLRSSDRGATFSQSPIPGGSVRNPPELLPAHPTDPDRVFARINGVTRSTRDAGVVVVPDSLVISADGGDTWQSALVGQGEIYGLAVSPDGTTVLVAYADPRDGSPVEESALGLWRASLPDLSFERVLDGSVTCVHWDDRGVLTCADPDERGWDIGLSTDGGDTFEPFLGRDQIRGPPECAAGTTVGDECDEREWSLTCTDILQLDDCPELPTPAPVDAGPSDAGVDASAPANGSPEAESGESSGCGCRVGGPAAAGSTSGVLLLFPLAFALRRRRG